MGTLGDWPLTVVDVDHSGSFKQGCRKSPFAAGRGASQTGLRERGTPSAVSAMLSVPDRRAAFGFAKEDDDHVEFGKA